MPTSNRAKTVFAGLALLLCSASAQARDYLIEVVLFETVAGKEFGNSGMYLPRIANSLRLNTEAAVAAGFLPVEQNLTLTQNAADIAASNRYRLLRHLSWRQPGLAADETRAVRVALGNSVPMFIPADLQPYPEFIPASANPLPDRSEAVSSPVVNGTITIRLGRFLHMDTRLVFTDEQNLQSFRLAQSRKMRSGELHYIDNPRFGILTRITPLEDKILEPAVDQSTENAIAAPE
jgi:hypothetical protein